MRKNNTKILSWQLLEFNDDKIKDMEDIFVSASLVILMMELSVDIQAFRYSH